MRWCTKIDKYEVWLAPGSWNRDCLVFTFFDSQSKKEWGPKKLPYGNIFPHFLGPSPILDSIFPGVENACLHGLKKMVNVFAWQRQQPLQCRFQKSNKDKGLLYFYSSRYWLRCRFMLNLFLIIDNIQNLRKI